MQNNVILALTKLSILQYLYYRLGSLSIIANSMLCSISQPRLFILNTKRLKIYCRYTFSNTYIKLHPIVIEALSLHHSLTNSISGPKRTTKTRKLSHQKSPAHLILRVHHIIDLHYV